MNLCIHERDGEKKVFDGRQVYWLHTPEKTGGRYSSICTVSYDPGAKAKPAHAHDKVGDEVMGLEPGTLVLFPQGVPHMVWNTGDIPLHMVCFYAPNADAIQYTFYEDFDF